MRIFTFRLAALPAVFVLSIHGGFCQNSQYNITVYGAVKNSGQLCTKSLQSAIDAFNAGGGGDWWGNGEPIHISVIRGKANVTLGKIENMQFNNIICKPDAGMLVYSTCEGIVRNTSFKNITFELVDRKINEITGGNIDLRGGLGDKNTLFARDIPGFLTEHVDGLTIFNLPAVIPE
jgi:hypothetical protein